jgi:LPS-assembly protein
MLRTTSLLPETLPGSQRSELASLIEGDLITGQPDLQTVIQGNASLRRGDTRIRADRLEYYPPDDRARATGKVHLNQAGNTYDGSELELKLETAQGFFNQVQYEFLTSGGHGQAKRVDFVDSSRSILHDVSYTTCKREDLPNWAPAWLLTAVSIETDTDENTGVAKDAQLSFLGITTPPLPSLSFPLNSDRKSGLLPPIFGMSSISGFLYEQPYYWNIAPNRDLTVTPTLMTKRGMDLNADFRYLEDAYRGEMQLDVLPDDKLRNGATRWGLWTHHQQTFDARALGLDALTGDLTINRVSDGNYWRDFTQSPLQANRLLQSGATLNWSKGDWSGQLLWMRYQALQDPLDPSLNFLPPYNREPELNARYSKYDWHGLDISFAADYTRFQADSAVQKQPNADRLVGNLQISLPWQTPAWYVIPKVQLHTAQYQFDAPLSNGASSANSTVPTFSVDSGMTFERSTALFGRQFTQTLEPRLFLAYTPYVDQSVLPIYDTALNDLSPATIFTENAFSGDDRISDAQTATVGGTSRLIDPNTGAEAVRFDVAQRFRFKNQNVTMPGQAPITDRASDLLFGMQINWSPKWSLSSAVQYNLDLHHSDRTVFMVKFMPRPYHTFSVAYRYQGDSMPILRDGSKSIDVGWQWPLNDLWGDKGHYRPGRGEGGGRWYAIGRLNYSLLDRRLVDGVVGFEYDACCWIGRVVLQRLTTGQVVSSANAPETRLLFQIEFNGFANIGSSGMGSVQRYIPGYTPLRGPGIRPSRFTNYD